MVNIFFSDSSAGTAKWLGICGKLEINTDKIIGLDLALHFGNIKKPFSITPRRDDYESVFECLSDEPKRQIRKLNRFMKDEKEICIWYSVHDIDEYLGMLATVERYKAKGIDIYLCDCSEICHSLRLLKEEDDFTTPEKIALTDRKYNLLMDEWQRLKEINAPLRLMKNGKATSYQEDYLDNDIFESIGNQEIMAARVYEKIYEKYPLIYDFILFRLHHLIESGHIVVVNQGILDYDGVPEPYFPKTIIKKA